jgi:hypothetical protein
VNKSGPHIAGQIVRSPEFVDVGVSRVLGSCVVEFLCHPILEESGIDGEATAGVPREPHGVVGVGRTVAVARIG